MIGWIIFESLNLDDEQDERFEGRFIYDYLNQLQHIKDGGERYYPPEYYYFRTKECLKELLIHIHQRIDKIDEYKNIYLGCHGVKEENSLSFTFGTISYLQFARIFENKLNGKRLFISACIHNPDELARHLFNYNKDMISILTTHGRVPFAGTYPLWITYNYFIDNYMDMRRSWKTQKGKGQGLTSSTIGTNIIEELIKIFGTVKLKFYYQFNGDMKSIPLNNT